MSLWLAVAAFIVVALVLLLLPLWRQQPAQDSSKKSRLWQTAGLLAVLPALTVGLYLHLGAPAILQELALTEAQSSYDVEGMVKALEEKLKSTPDDAEGWYALGRAYIAFNRYADAEEALRKAATQAPKDARILAQYAEAMALGQNSLDGRPLELIREALEISYEDEKALELAGLAAFQKENWAEALHYWRRLLKLLPKETDQHDAIAQAVRTAEKNMEGTP
ncbi:MAG: tetratricopeptide repeat protein [Rhodocyclales bacterium]|nr:tetratricopeptide repeat protein [Rhodocyclales bacterium]